MPNDPIEAPTIPVFKPGYKTSEFIITLLATIGTLGGQLAGVIPPPWGLIVAAVATAAYSISRGLAKSG